MNIHHLKTLIAVHDHDTFADAAESLFLTPAAVSQQIRNLEDELQVPLFDRTTRPPRMNAHGVSIVEQARDVLDRFNALAARARSPGEVAGTLIIGSGSLEERLEKHRHSTEMNRWCWMRRTQPPS